MVGCHLHRRSGSFTAEGRSRSVWAGRRRYLCSFFLDALNQESHGLVLEKKMGRKEESERRSWLGKERTRGEGWK